MSYKNWDSLSPFKQRRYKKSDYKLSDNLYLLKFQNMIIRHYLITSLLVMIMFFIQTSKGHSQYRDWIKDHKNYNSESKSNLTPENTNREIDSLNNIGDGVHYSWSNLGDGLNGAVYAIAIDGDDIYVGGNFTASGTMQLNYIAKWNTINSTWSPLGQGLNGPVWEIFVDENDIYVGGTFRRTFDNVTTLNSIARWNKTTLSWNQMGQGVGGSNSFVWAIVKHEDNLFIGGRFSSVNSIQAGLVAKWDITTSTWYSLAGGGLWGFDPWVSSLVIHGDELIISGRFSETPNNNITVRNLVKYNINSEIYNTLGGVVNGDILTMTKKNNKLYIGGTFNNVGGISAKLIAYYDFTLNQWKSLGSGAGGPPYPGIDVIHLTGEDVYIGGYFTKAGGLDANYIAKWDGVRWNSLGGGMNSEVYAINTIYDKLYIGGKFTSFIHNDNSYISKTTIEHYSATSNLKVLNPKNNQTYSSGSNINIRWEIDNQISYVKIEYSTDFGNSWSLIINNYSSALGNFNWVTPQLFTDNAVIKITNVNNNNDFATSEGKFRIVENNLNFGLIAHYPFLTEANDHSGYKNNPSFNNALLTSDRFGNPNSTYKFNGIDNFIKIPNSSYLVTPVNSISISSWIQIDQWYNDFAPILCKSENYQTSLAAYELMLMNRPNEKGIHFMLNGNFIFQSYEFQLNQWYHVVATWDGKLCYFYVNNNYIGSKPYSGQLISNDQPLILGKDVPGQTEYLNGKLDDVRIYNRVLSDFDINQLYSYNFSELNVVTPKVYDYYIPGETIEITWTPVLGISNIRIEYSTNNGNSWNSIVNSINASATKYFWNSPSNLNSDKCKIKITNLNNNSQTALSSGNFRIKNHSLEYGLIAHYQFDEDFYDNSVYANNPSLVNAGLSYDRFYDENRAANFNGLNNTIQIPNSLSLTSINNQFTISSWVYINQWYYDVVPIVEKHGLFGIRLINYNNLSRVQVRINNRLYEFPYQFQIDNWYYLTFTFDQNVGKVYVNNELINSFTDNNIIPDNSPITLGYYYHQWNNIFFLDGKLDDFRLYNRALSVEEINTLYTPAPILNNIAFGKPVTITSNGAEEFRGQKPADVTDGSLMYNPGDDFNDGCIGYRNDTYNELMVMEVKIHLGAIYKIQKVRYNMGNVQRADSWNADKMISPLGNSSTKPGTSYNGAWTEHIGEFTDSVITIRLEKTRIQWNQDWLFIGEIEVYGSAYTNILQITNPKSNEVLNAGTNQFITWTGAQGISNVRIEFSPNDGIHWDTIVPTYPAGYNNYQWTVPNINSDQCKIKITSRTDPSITATSGTFKIQHQNVATGLINLKVHDELNQTKKIRLRSTKFLKLGPSEWPDTNVVPIAKTKNLVYGQCNFALIDLIDMLPENGYKIYVLEALDDFNNHIGYIHFEYSKHDLNNQSKVVDVFVFVDTKTSTDVGYFQYPGWKYFVNSSQRLMYLLLPPHEKFNEIRLDKQPTLFVHGIYGKYPYWGAVPFQLYNDFDAWQLYYPYDMKINNCSDILKKSISKIFNNSLGNGNYINSSINLIAHSMGGLVSRHYIQNTIDHKVKKLLMLGTPNHGSLSSYRLRKNETGSGTGSEYLGKDPNSPAHIDMSPSSNFLTNLLNTQEKILSENLNKSYLIIAGVLRESGILIGHRESDKQDDGVVGVPSASLLNKQIPLATVKLHHSELSNNINVNIIKGFLNSNFAYNPENSWYNMVFNNVNSYYFSRIAKLKYDNDNNYHDDKGFLNFKIHNYSYSGFLNFKKSGNGYIFKRQTKRGGYYLQPNPKNYHNYFTRNKAAGYDHLSVDLGIEFNNEINIKHIKDEDKKIRITNNPFYFYNLESNYLDLNLHQTDLKLSNANSYLGTGNLSRSTRFSSKLESFENLFAQNVFVDNSIDTLFMYLSGTEGDTSFVNNNLILNDPNDNLIDSTVANNNPNIEFQFDNELAFAYYMIINPVPGNWIVQYNSNLDSVNLIVPIQSEIFLNTSIYDSSYISGDSVIFFAQIPTVAGITNAQIESDISYSPTGSDSVFAIVSVGMYSVNDSMYRGAFLANSSGEYDIEFNFTCTHKGEAIHRKNYEYTFVASVLPPELVYPHQDSTSVPIDTLEFVWSSSRNADNYQIELFNIFDSLSVQSSILNDTSLLITNLERESQYIWRVRSISVNDSSEWSQFNFFYTIMYPPLPPQLVSPPDSAGGLSNNVTFNWYYSENASRYKLTVAKDDNFNEVVFSDENLQDTSYTVEGLEEFTRYYWKVRAFNEGGASDESFVRLFRTMGAPMQVNTIFPASETSNQPTQQKFKWNESLDNVNLRTANNQLPERGNIIQNPVIHYYHYWFELTSDTNTFVDLFKDTTVTDTFKIVTDLSHVKDYFWRVKSRNDAGWNEFGEWKKFTTIVPPLITASVYPELRSSMSYTLGMTNLTIESNITNAATVTASFYNKPPIETDLPAGLTSISHYYWTINDSGIVFTNGKIKIPVSKIGGVTNPSNLRWLKRDFASDDWQNIGGEIVGGNLVSTVPFDSFSEFAIGATDAQPLQSSYFEVKFVPEGLYLPAQNVLARNDTVKAYLVNTSLVAIDSSYAILDSVTFTAIFDFKHAVTGDYYIVVKHLNSLETWSKAGGESFERFETMFYDFTFQQTSAYGNNLVFVENIWCIFSGDVNQDGVIDAQDRALCWNLRNVAGYYPEDVNGDGLVNAQDRGIIWNNRNKSVQIPNIIIRSRETTIPEQNESGRINSR